jgi:GNAT superfamily N-acetyltransferase
MIRFGEHDAASRLDTLVERYRRDRRGMGLWLSPDATPSTLPFLLRARGFRCRKHFPAMVRRLAEALAPLTEPGDLVIEQVREVDRFEETAHPSIGPPTTQLRRRALDRLRALVGADTQRIVPFVAYLQGQPVGASELFLGARRSAGLIGLSVLPSSRGRGIGAALLEHTCREAASRGALTVSLIATGDGEQLYARRGFSEVARFA